MRCWRCAPRLAKAVVGQEGVVSGLVIALLCRGHVLLEGVPGVAKTLLVRALSAALQLEFKRVQFTPDLMPGDVTGSLVYDARTAAFVFRPGPVFTNLLLADEINRTPPKTQAALLEAMEERQVSVDGDPKPLPDPFIVAATQNPIEYEGTYQLPEAQLDRFLLKLNVTLPSRDAEIAILGRHAHGFDPRDLSAIKPVAGPAELAAARQAVLGVLIADEVLGYIVDIVGATRSSPALQLGVSPRGATALLGTARSWAWLSGRNYVTPDDVKAMARPTLRHRVMLRPEAELEGRNARRCARRNSGVGSGAPLVILTGRIGLLALICVLPIAASPWPARAFAGTAGGAVDPGGRRCRAGRQHPQIALYPITRHLGPAGAAGGCGPADPQRRPPPFPRPDPRRLAAQRARRAAHSHRQHRRRATSARRDPAAAGSPRRPAGGRGHGPIDRAAGVGRTAGFAAGAGQVRVLPPFLSRKHLPSRLAKLREIDGLLPTLIRGQGTEFDSLREYVVGDDVRSIDWRASARRADVVVRTWRPERDRRVVIVLDTGRTAAGRVGVDPTAADPAGWPRLDWSMDAALLLAALASRAGDHVDFLAHDRLSRAGVFGASRTELLAQLVEAMAPLQPALIESDWRAMVAAIARRTRRRSLVVLLTDLNATALDEGLLPVLPQLSAKHHVLVAAVADPRVDQMAAGRSDAAAVYDAAAAERARNDRGAIAARLRRSGVEVVDARPTELAPALADRYLAMKATGRL